MEMAPLIRVSSKLKLSVLRVKDADRVRHGSLPVLTGTRWIPECPIEGCQRLSQ
jgi:hypothetical protein